MTQTKTPKIYGVIAVQFLNASTTAAGGDCSQ